MITNLSSSVLILILYNPFDKFHLWVCLSERIARATDNKLILSLTLTIKISRGGEKGWTIRLKI